jgi:zinc/manganese transport system substrate-binding protein
MKRTFLFILGVVVLLIISGIIFVKPNATNKLNSKIQIVAADNFWGNLASQIGGGKVTVLSIVSDPNADPHEYAINTTDARAVTNANLVVVNGAGYDSWANKLLVAAPRSDRRVINVASYLGLANNVNPHFWYSPQYVNSVSTEIKLQLCNIDVKNCSYYQSNYKALLSSLSIYQNKVKQIAKEYSATNVAATEDIFAYLAKPAGLNLVSPIAFTQSVAEGNDPPAGSIATFEGQLKSRQVKILVYNNQTNTRLTNTMKAIARSQNIPIVGISETMNPTNTTFQSWMDKQVSSILLKLRQR